MRFLNLSVTDAEERAGILAAIKTVLDHGRVVLGPEVEAFEQRIADYCGRRFAVGLNSGTDALILGLKALDIGAGDEVITTPLSWLATGSAILLNGATAVVGDVDDGLNLDPATIEALITPRTKAILPVHFTGNLARMPEIQEIASAYGIAVVEDGAQAFGRDPERKAMRGVWQDCLHQPERDETAWRSGRCGDRTDRRCGGAGAVGDFAPFRGGGPRVLPGSQPQLPFGTPCRRRCCSAVSIVIRR